MKVRLIAGGLWLALFAAALLMIRDENRHTAAPLLIHAGGEWCDVPKARPPLAPANPPPPFSRKGDVA